jgi:hypothetical protein
VQQMSNDRDRSQGDIESPPPKHLILRIAAATLLVVAVRVAATASMAGGCAGTGDVRPASSMKIETAAARAEKKTHAHEEMSSEVTMDATAAATAVASRHAR